ncbi:hypothetical protein [Chlorogloea sp. CCALA 695]|uniref:hypothetical protein n=1 Tax=Chlorogloea sp. CCALA 695 TaxID=2107693 RepID=UPI000D068E6E|nr:hypothetical protein [Chlorogloea sp. CCALA 695]PSB27274.1 hypothetical protein C7B70_23020 [Chlorogloea sp. CCALA 695]
MSINNLQHISNDELIERFKEATRHGKPPRELIDELATRPGIAFLNPTRNAEDTMAVVRAAIEKLEKNNRQNLS